MSNEQIINMIQNGEEGVVGECNIYSEDNLFTKLEIPKSKRSEGWNLVVKDVKINDNSQIFLVRNYSLPVSGNWDYPSCIQKYL